MVSPTPVQSVPHSDTVKMIALPSISNPTSVSPGQSEAATRPMSTLTTGKSLPTSVTIPSPRSSKDPSTFPTTSILKGTSPPSQVSQGTPSAHPSTSAEQQWIQTVVNPMLTDSTPNATPVTTSKPYSFSRTTAATTSSLKPPPPPPSHVVFQSDDIPSTSKGLLPGQVYAQKRLEHMQREVDQVIGVMTLNFEDDCVVHPDKKLQEIYGTCPDYGTKWGECGRIGGAGGDEEEEDDEETARKRRRFWRQVAILLALLLIIGLFFLGDWMMSEWLIVQESRQEVIEALLKKQKMLEARLVQRNNSSGNGTSFIGGNLEETTVVIVDSIVEEDIKAELVEGDDKEDRSLSSGHGVLDPAWLVDDDDDEDDEPSLMAANLKDLLKKIKKKIK